MGTVGKIARRTFLLGSMAVTGGIAIGYYAYKTPFPNPLEDDLAEGEAALTPYVLVRSDGVTIVTPRGEMGQGVQSTLAALVAEELDLEWSQVKIMHGPPSKAYYNEAVLEEGLPISTLDESRGANFMRNNLVPVIAKFMAMQSTGGSSSIPDGYEKMRVAGATAREILKTAAAKKWNARVADLKTEAGEVIAPDGSRLSYEALAAEAGDIKPPKKVELRPKSQWRFLGKSMPRLDMVEKCTGTANFAMDIRLPDMKFATVKMNPHLGAPMKSYDASKAEAVNGVSKVIPLTNGVAVVADNTWTAMKAADLIEFDWAKAGYPEDMDGHYAAVAESFTPENLDSRNRDDGDVDEIIGGSDVIAAEYKVPYLAHATMEPVGATALLKGGRLDIWTGTQSPLDIQTAAKTITGLSDDNIHVHTVYMGGGFGRKSETDFSDYAVKIAKAMEGTPVKVTWSREEDMTHDQYRPVAMGRFRAKIQDGSVRAADFSVACPSLLSSMASRGGPNIPGADITSAQAIWDQPYAIPHYRCSAYKAPDMLPLGAWRSVGATQNGFFHESMMDELAHAAGKDPMEFRLSLMNNDTCRKVLETVAEASNWGGSLPGNHALGVAFVLSFGVPTAEVFEVSQQDGGIKLENIWAAVDVGTALDPRNVEAQVQGGINYGLSAALNGEITVEDGKVVQTNFHDYDGLRMHQAPNINVSILENGKHIRGVGEPGTPPAAPALANALFALTGTRARELPLNKTFTFI